MPTPTAGALGREVTLVGRCVDEAGAPLADVSVQGQLQPTGGGRTLVEREQRSAADGTFVLAVPTVEGGIVSLALRADGRCQLDGSIHDAVAGERRDFGDLLLPLARRVRGRVVDTAGVPQADVGLTLYRSVEGQARRIFEASTQGSAESDAVGSFVCRRDLPGGRYWIQLDGREFAAGATHHFELAGDVREHVLELVVSVAKPSPTCRGVVVRSDGAPIAGAAVELDGNRTVTAADGRFALTPNGSLGPGQRRIEVAASGYLRRNDLRWSFGDATELRIELQPMPGIVVLVVDGASGAPIEQFTVRVEYPNTWAIRPENGQRLHPGGIARVDSDPGDRVVLVTAQDPNYAPSAFVPVAVPKDRDVSVTVSLWPEQQRRLVLRDGRGPAAGVDVELLDPGDLVVRRNTETWPLDGSRVGGLPMARIVQRGTTDADGVLLLRGPKGDLALRLSGGDLALQIVQPIRLDAAEDLLVTAQRGARVRGRLVPPEVARHVLAAGQVGPNDQPVRIGIDLITADGESLHRHLEAPFPLDAEGAFDMRGVPAGTWHVAVVQGHRTYAAVAIDVPEAGEVERDVDIAVLAPAFVTLRVLVDGEPARDTFVNARGTHGKTSFGQPFRSGAAGTTDAQGVLHVETYVGEIELEVNWTGAADRTQPNQSRLQTRLLVPRAGVQEIVVDLRLGGLDLSLLRPDGGPAAEIEVRVVDMPSTLHWRTDAAGRLVSQTLVAGSYPLEVRPRRLATAASQQAYQQANGWEALQHEWVAIGVVTVAPGAAAPQRLVLPAAWER